MALNLMLVKWVHYVLYDESVTRHKTEKVTSYDRIGAVDGESWLYSI